MGSSDPENETCIEPMYLVNFLPNLRSQLIQLLSNYV